MPIGPLKNLPVFRSGSSDQSGHAQNFSPTYLGRKSIKGAKTSMSQAMGDTTKISTSISHPGGVGRGATTSINRPTEAVSSLSREGMSDDKRDGLRYNHIRELVKARQQEEKEKVSKKAEVGTEDVYGKTVKQVGFSTGGLHRTSGARGMEQKFYRAARKNPDTYRNLSAKDRDYIFNLIQSHAKKLRPGSSFGRKARRSMKRDVRKGWKGGNFSRADANDYKKIIDNLPH